MSFPTDESQYSFPKKIKATPTSHPIPHNLPYTTMQSLEGNRVGQSNKSTTGLKPYLIPKDLPKKTYVWSDEQDKLIERSSNDSITSAKSFSVGTPKVVPARGKVVIATSPISRPYMSPVIKDNDVYGILNLSQDQGLPSNFIECAVKDRLGRVWLGTDNGLVLMEGDQIKVYTVDNGLSSNHISCLLIDNEKLWIGTYTGGVNLFENGCFTHFKKENGLILNDVNTLAKVGKKLWVGTVGGLICLENDQFTHYTTANGLSANSVMRLLVDNSRLWIATYDSGLNLLENGRITQYTTANGLSDNHITSLVKGDQGLWIGTTNGGLNFWNNNRFAHYTTKNGLPHNEVTRLLKKNNQLWIGTKGGVSLLENGQFTYYNVKNGLSSNNISCFLEANDRLYIGTQDLGINVLKKDQFTHYGVKDGLLDSYISNLWLDKDKVYIATLRGLSCLQNDQFTHYTTENGLKSNSVWSIVGGDSAFWIGSSKGLSLMIQDHMNHFTSKDVLLASNVWSLLQNNRMLCIGYNGSGFSILEEGSEGKLTHYNAESGLSDGHVSCFAQEGNKLWIGTNGGGVNLLKEGVFEHFNTKAGLSNDQVTSLLAEHGRLWVGTNGGGVNIIENGQIIHYTRQNGLADNGVTQLALDSLGQVWVGTNRGLTRFTRKNNGYYKLKNWTKADGFKFMSFNAYGNPMVIDKKGRLWASVGAGLTSFQLPAKDTTSPKLFITGVDIKQKKVNWLPISQFKNLADTLYNVNQDMLLSAKLSRDTSWLGRSNISWNGVENVMPYWLPKKLVLPHDQNYLTFHFSGLKNSEQSSIIYRYMLVGLDTEWSTFTKEGKAEYKNMPPGRYTFRVRAKGRNDVWSEEASFQFKITPPWWQTWWAYTLYVVSGSLLVYGLILWRTQALKARQRILERVVAERTVDLQEANEELRSQKEEISTRNEELHQSQEELEAQRDYIAQRNQELTRKNTQINQSIKAAKSIQQALLPSEQRFAESFNDYFIFFRPRDVVSGDFYWLTKTKNTLWLAVADCTGHGVPGAFMTMLGKSLLERLINVKKIKTPAEVLQKLDEEVISTLRQKETNNRSGMDIILLKITKNETIDIQYAGAKNALYVANENGDIITYKADRISIGGIKRRSDCFANQIVKVSEKTELFLSTDGFEDQNNIDRKSYNRGRLMTLLREVSTLPSAEQKHALLSKTLDTHMQGTEQRDDILVVGIKL
ncbi:hypothetical protein BKI52_38715 [marine bacterium AO1-C]|nr:hypothetical protein BKI52_38715 [marine bacterium AO1-C]